MKEQKWGKKKGESKKKRRESANQPWMALCHRCELEKTQVR